MIMMLVESTLIGWSSVVNYGSHATRDRGLNGYWHVGVSRLFLLSAVSCQICVRLHSFLTERVCSFIGWLLGYLVGLGRVVLTVKLSAVQYQSTDWLIRSIYCLVLKQFVVWLLNVQSYNFTAVEFATISSSLTRVSSFCLSAGRMPAAILIDFAVWSLAIAWFKQTLCVQLWKFSWIVLCWCCHWAIPINRLFEFLVETWSGLWYIRKFSLLHMYVTLIMSSGRKSDV